MADLGRNAPCPCGSKKKFKKCCGNPTAVPSNRPLVGGVRATHLRFRIELLGTEPPIWRLVRVPAEANFRDLHYAIQDCGWSDDHAWEFRDRLGRKTLAGPGGMDGVFEQYPDAGQLRLTDHFVKPGATCRYIYDFGDHWDHEITLVSADNDASLGGVEILGGEGEFPPEDCGGVDSFARIKEFLETGRDPWGHDGEMEEMWGYLREPQSEDEEDEEDEPSEEDDPPEASATASTPSPGDVPVTRRAFTLDGAVVPTLWSELDIALTETAARFGLVAQLHKATYSKTSFASRFELCVVRDDGVVMNSDAECFLERCNEYGLTRELLGRSFDHDDRTLRVIGLTPRRKQPVLCLQIDPVPDGGALFSFPADFIRHLLLGCPHEKREAGGGPSSARERAE